MMLGCPAHKVLMLQISSHSYVGVVEGEPNASEFGAPGVQRE